MHSLDTNFLNFAAQIAWGRVPRSMMPVFVLPNLVSLLNFLFYF